MKGILPLILCLLICLSSNAQNEIESLTNSEDRKSLFKLNLVDMLGFAGGYRMKTQWYYAPSLIFEHKLFPKWSGLIHVNYAVINDFCKCNESVFRLGTRYYYNIDRRIRLGKQLNKFSGNYLLVEYGHGFRYDGAEQAFYQGPFRAFMGYGLQRRLWKYGFLDLGFGLIGYFSYTIIPWFDFAIGFAI